MGWTILGYVVLGVVLLAAVYFIAAYNSFISLRNKFEEANATVDVYCKKRYDLIPNLVETVKGYAKHEEQTFTKVVEARANAMQSKTSAESQANETALEGALKSLFAIAENYPDLKANQGFLDLQSQLSGIESEIASARKYYNAIVKNFNTKTQTIPSSIVASICKFEKQPYYEVMEEERQNVKVSF
ncbi:MAG: LemA family protein [Clostridiaceae bacterium]|nr:LemA family protein [Clostridiaceae bacterium]